MYVLVSAPRGARESGEIRVGGDGVRVRVGDVGVRVGTVLYASAPRGAREVGMPILPMLLGDKTWVATGDDSSRVISKSELFEEVWGSSVWGEFSCS